MNKDIKVSVVVPVYNVEKYLYRCIESIVNQTYSNLEIVLVDDGSLDNCPQMCDDWADKDNRIQVIHKPNGGLSDARNTGINVITGDYVWFVDSDDYIEQTAIEKLVDNAIMNNSDVVVFGMNKDISGNISKISLHFELLYPDNKSVKEKILKRYYTNDHACVYSVCNKMYKTNFILENGLIFDPNDVRCEDCWFNFKVFHIANVVSFIDEYYYYYYDNSESITHNIDNISYDRWVRNKERLLADEFSKEISIDYNRFYYEFLFNVIIYLKDLLKLGNAELFEKIVSDEFLDNALNYTAVLPKHIKLIARLIKNNKISLLKLIYKIWNIK